MILGVRVGVESRRDLGGDRTVRLREEGEGTDARAQLAARGERGAGQRAVREGGSLRLPGGPRWVGVHAPGGRRGERDAAGASGALACVVGRAGAGRRELGRSVERDARVRVGPSWAGSFAGPRGEREKRLGWVELVGSRDVVWVGSSLFSFFFLPLSYF